MLVQAFKNETLVYEGRIHDSGDTEGVLTTVVSFLHHHEVGADAITLFGGPSRRSESYSVSSFEKITFRFAPLHQRIAASTNRPAPYQIPRSHS
jgi:hypothetical protein